MTLEGCRKSRNGGHRRHPSSGVTTGSGVAEPFFFVAVCLSLVCALLFVLFCTDVSCVVAGQHHIFGPDEISDYKLCRLCS